MKAKLYIITLISIALFGSCNDFLDVVPDNRTVLDSPEAVQQLLVDAYPYASYFHLCEVMSDNAGERTTTATHSRDILNREMYFWEEGFLSGTGQDTPSYLWNGYYNAIATANQALQSISEASDKSKYNAQKGEALVCRAFNHFILVNIFAEHYDPATADKKLGIPYNTEPENIAVKRYKRNSIAEVYALIEKDLTEGLPLINDNVYEVPKYHFTKAAAHAFASRFYLYKGDWDKTIEHATLALGDNMEVKILPLNTTAFVDAAYQVWQAQYRRVDQPDILLMAGSSSWWARDATSSSLRYGMIRRHSDAVYDSLNIEGTLTTYYKRWVYSTTNAYLTYKYYEYFKYSYQGATTGIGYIMGVLLTTEEALMNRAEAYSMKNEFDKAIDDMSILLKKRIRVSTFSPITVAKVKTQYDNKQSLYPDLSPFYKSSVSADQMSFLKFITDWRRKEFFSEGMRWFDIKRFHLEVTHLFDMTSAQNPDIKPIVLSADDPRRAVQIPNAAQAFGVEANPR